LSGPAPVALDRVGEIAVCVQRRLESLYGLDPEAPVTDYLVPAGAVSHLPGGGSRTLVAQEGDEVSVGVVLDESVGAGLERTDPRERLDGSNLGSFTTLTEEVSHFLYVLSRARRDRSMTQLELELQGEIDKYLVVLFFRGLEDEGAVSERLRQLLFERYELTAGLSVESSDTTGLEAREPRTAGSRRDTGPQPARGVSARRGASGLGNAKARDDRGPPPA
jgi:hypothetical protein